MNRGLLLYTLKQGEKKIALFQNTETNEGVLFTVTDKGSVKEVIPSDKFRPDELLFQPLSEGAEIVFISHFETRMIFDQLSKPRTETIRNGQNALIRYVSEHPALLNYEDEKEIRISAKEI